MRKNQKIREEPIEVCNEEQEREEKTVLTNDEKLKTKEKKREGFSR